MSKTIVLLIGALLAGYALQWEPRRRTEFRSLGSTIRPIALFMSAALHRVPEKPSTARREPSYRDQSVP
jgi:hypothetical protein